jgi:hypothetical protein
LGQEVQKFFKAIWSFKTSEATWPVAKNYIPEDLDLQNNCCENLKISLLHWLAFLQYFSWWHFTHVYMLGFLWMWSSLLSLHETNTFSWQLTSGFNYPLNFQCKKYLKIKKKASWEELQFSFIYVLLAHPLQRQHLNCLILVLFINILIHFINHKILLASSPLIKITSLPWSAI